MPSSYDDVSGTVEAGLGFDFWDTGIPAVTRRIEAAPERPAERKLPPPVVEDEEAVPVLPHPFSSDHDVYGYRREREYEDSATMGESYTYSLYSDENLGSWLYH